MSAKPNPSAKTPRIVEVADRLQKLQSEKAKLTKMMEALEGELADTIKQCAAVEKEQASLRLELQTLAAV